MIRWVVALALFTLIYFEPCYAQSKSKKNQKTEKSEKADEEEKKSDRNTPIEFPVKSTFLETPVDAKKYKVGPGDELMISILGQVNEFYRTPISPEGKVVIPSVSVIDVKDLLLSEAKQKIMTEIRKVYPSVDISVDLVLLRRFRIQVTGLVRKSGAVDVSGVDRVSYAVQESGGSTGSMRNIELRNPNRPTRRVDLVKKKNAGVLDTDPFLSEGDVVYVPEVYARVFVFGSVSIPDEYEFVTGERISDIIELSGGLSYGVDSLEGYIVRFKEDTGRYFQRINIHLNRVFSNPEDTVYNVRIYPDDRIFFRQKYLFHPKKNVTLEGEVLRPGDYAIEEGVTTITDVIAQAGGFTPDVAIGKIIVYRHKDIEGMDAEFERLKKISYGEMTEIERAYFKAKSRQEVPPVQTDFLKLFNNGKIDENYNVKLKHGDIISVTRSKKTVTLVGGVLHAGILDYVPGKNYKYYIDKAGGYKTIAKRRDVVIIKAFGQQWDDASENTKIEDGDVIFVPEKEPIDGWQLFKDLLAITGQIAAITSTIILVIYTVRN